MIVILSHFAALSAYSQIDITVREPTEGQISGSPLQVFATVNSEYELSKVTASVEGREATLTFSGGSFGTPAFWGGSIDLVGLPKGELTGVVTAVDVLGNSVTSSVFTFVYDEKPMLTVLEPVADSVATPTIRIRASCSDDTEDCQIELIIMEGGHSLKTLLFGAEIDEDVDFSEFKNLELTLSFQVRDSVNRFVNETRRIHVIDNARLIPIQSAPGKILDIGSDRLLYRVGEEDADQVLGIMDRETGETTILYDEPGGEIERASLTPLGAIFSGRSEADNRFQLFEFDGEGLINLNAGDPSSFVAKSHYAIWSNDTTLVRRDFLAATNLVVSGSAGNWRNDLSADGAVAFWTGDYQVFLYRDGLSHQVSQSMDHWNIFPLTDGTNVVFLRKNGDSHEVILQDGITESILLPESPMEFEPSFNYLIEGGWVAFTKPGTGVPYQVWAAKVGGMPLQRSIFGTSSTIVRLNDQGSLIFKNKGTAGEELGSKYLSRPNGHFIDLGSYNGETIWLEEKWWVYLGRSLFVLNATDELLVQKMSIASRENGNYWLEFERNSDQNLMLQTSDNLSDWSNVREIESTEVEVELGLSGGKGLSPKFYRLRVK